ncbi:hypothetical protein AKJ16_DCAP07103 [Drosera capensis]
MSILDRPKFVLRVRKQYFTAVQHDTVAVPVATVSSKLRRSSPSPAHTISSAVTAALISKPKSTPQISPISCSISQTLLAPTLNRSSIESCCDGQEVHSDPNSLHRCRILRRLRLNMGY